VQARESSPVSSHRSRRHEAAAASHICVTEAPPPVIFVRVQVSHISCGGGALKLSGLLISTRIKLVAPTDKKEIIVTQEISFKFRNSVQPLDIEYL